jgi:hypothetical protein
VPFLPSQKDTQTLDNQALKRPYIEFILRQRLQNSSKDSSFYDQVNNILNNKSNFKDSTFEDVRSTLLALTGQDNIENVTDTLLKNFNSFSEAQAETIKMLVKAIKVCLKELDFAIRELEQINVQISLQPLPNVEGPEFGGSIKTDWGIKQPSEIDKQIAIMNLTKLNNEFKAKVDTSKIGGGNDLFASSIVADLNRDFEDPIQKKQKIRDELGSQAINHIRTIEIITGEVSGLGLIDILAIYCALWSMDMHDLLGFLDEDALNRLIAYFPELTNIEVFNQVGKRPDIVDTLSNFEKILFNILSFADKTFIGLRRVRLEPRGNNVG